MSATITRTREVRVTCGMAGGPMDVVDVLESASDADQAIARYHRLAGTRQRLATAAAKVRQHFRGQRRRSSLLSSSLESVGDGFRNPATGDAMPQEQVEVLTAVANMISDRSLSAAERKKKVAELIDEFDAAGEKGNAGGAGGVSAVESAGWAADLMGCGGRGVNVLEGGERGRHGRQRHTASPAELTGFVADLLAPASH